MFPTFGPIVLYDFFRWVGAAIFVACAYRILSASLPGQRGKILLFLAGGTLATLYGGAVIPFLDRLIRGDPAPTFLGSGRFVHSTFLAVLLYAVVGLRWLRFPVRNGLDHGVILGALAGAVSRLGCFAEGCCAGKPTSLIWGLAFPDNPLVRVHPTQLYMFGAEGLLFWILLRMNRAKRYDGEVFWTGVWLYSLYRLWIETLRTNPVFLWSLTHAQAFSIPALLLSSGLLIFYRRNPPGDSGAAGVSAT